MAVFIDLTAAGNIAASIDLPRELWRDFSKIASGLWQAYLGTDASLAEINPLVITRDNRLVALDGKMILDDNALFRHPELAEMRDLDEEAPAETRPAGTACPSSSSTAISAAWSMAQAWP